MDHSFAGDRHEIIGQCRRASPEDCLGYQPWGNIVLKIDSYRAVKFGPSVSKDEAENQAAISASQPRDTSCAKSLRLVPRCRGLGVYCHGIYGRRASKHLGEDKYKAKFLEVIKHLHSIKATKIGPLYQGPHRAIIFGEGPSPVLKSIQDVEAWFTRRLCDNHSSVDFSKLDLVLCHLDFTCRNILRSEGQPPCLLDWACAGFYPRFFEKLCQDIIGQPEDGNVAADMRLSNIESVQYWLTAKAFANDMRYCL